MEKLEYEIEFITPAFIGGADQRAELRPASFIGLLRWWWRVVLASFLAEAEDIYEWDSKLFGNQKKAGRVFLKLKNTAKNEETDRLSKPLYMLGIGGRNRRYIKPGATFKLQLIVPDNYKEIVDSLIQLAITFGGIGYRGRKGFGSMRLTNIDVGYEVLKISYWQNLIEKLNLKETKPNFNLPNLRNLALLKYSPRNEDWSWQQAINTLGEIYKRIRRPRGRKTPEYYSCIYYFLRSEEIDSGKVNFANLPFGLPIMFQSRSLYTGHKRRGKEEHAKAQLNWKPIHEESSDKEKPTEKRRASSILFNIKEDGIYALAFRCKFLPENSELQIQAKGDYWKLKGQKKPPPININFSESVYTNVFDQVIQRLKSEGFEEVKL